MFPLLFKHTASSIAEFHNVKCFYTTLCLFLLNIELVHNDMVLVFAKPLKPLKVLDDKDHGGRVSAPTFERRMNFRLKTLKSFFPPPPSFLRREGGRAGGISANNGPD